MVVYANTYNSEVFNKVWKIHNMIHGAVGRMPRGLGGNVKRPEKSRNDMICRERYIDAMQYKRVPYCPLLSLIVRKWKYEDERESKVKLSMEQEE